MTGLVVAIIFAIFMPFALIMWNRQRVKGKMLCLFCRDDKSLLLKLCELRDDWVIFGTRAYDVYPDYVRITRFPAGWPAFLQELVPCALYDEEIGVPMNWVNLEKIEVRSMELRAALDENWLRKLVEETAREGAGFRINWRKYLPIGLIIIGVLGLVMILVLG